MNNNDIQRGRPAQLYAGLKANIEAITGLTEGCVAYATDTDEQGTYDGATWNWGGGGGGASTSDDVTMPKVGTPNINTLTEVFNTLGGAGVADSTIAYVLIDPGSGTHYVKVEAGEGYLRTTNDQQGVLKIVEWPALTGIDIPVPASGEISVIYIGVEYNAGTPQAVSHATYDWNFYDNFPLARVTHDGVNIHVFNEYLDAVDVNVRLQRMLRLVLPFVAEASPDGDTGFVVSNVATRQLAMTGGTLWHGVNRYVFDAIVAGSSFSTYYRNGAGGFVQTVGVTQWPNTKIDDDSGTLVTIENGEYSNLWIYLDLSAGQLAIIYGQHDIPAGYGSVGEATEEQEPEIPEHLRVHGKLLARWTFLKSATVPAHVTTADFNPFNLYVLAPINGEDSMLVGDTGTNRWKARTWTDFAQMMKNELDSHYLTIVDGVEEAGLDDGILWARGEGTWHELRSSTIPAQVSVPLDWDGDYGALDKTITDALNELAQRARDLESHTHAVPDASVIPFSPADNTDWNGSADPGDVDNALDQLADRTKTLESHTHSAPDASAVTYTPSDATDWTGDVDPGNVDDALDQLVDRLNIITKSSGATIDIGTDDVKFLTAKAVNDSHNIPWVVPGTSGNVMTSDGTDWVSSTPSASGAIDYDQIHAEIG